jgi:hypothetical protein
MARSCVATLLSLAMLVAPFPAAAEILDYDCAIGELKVSLHVDTQGQTVRQIVQFGSVTEVAEYDDGVYGPVSHAGITALIPSVHQFVHVNEELIYYGAEVRGVEEGAVLNKRLLTITLPNGKSGWCLMADKK